VVSGYYQKSSGSVSESNSCGKKECELLSSVAPTKKESWHAYRINLQLSAVFLLSSASLAMFIKFDGHQGLSHMPFVRLLCVDFEISDD
jgi:hypothetical protein